MSALEHPDRVCSIRLYASNSQLGRMATVMQRPFPAMTCLHITSRDDRVPVLPAKFLGGSAPCLQEIYLLSIPFPSLPKFLLSASDLVTLQLHKIPPTGYFSPKEMVACLAALPKLNYFTIKFLLAEWPDRIRSPPVTRIVLPALTSFTFQGSSEYLENLIAQIDSPELDRIHIIYLNQLGDVPVTRLSKFIDRSAGPELTPFRRAYVSIRNDGVTFILYRQNYTGWAQLSVGTNISFSVIDGPGHVSHMAAVLSQFSAALSNVVHVKLELHLDTGYQLEGTDNGEWLHLLHRFSTMKSLYVSWTLARHVALALEVLTAEMAAEVFPSLHLIFLAGQPESSIEKFIAVRRLSGCPVAMVDTEMEFERLVSCQ